MSAQEGSRGDIGGSGMQRVMRALSGPYAKPSAFAFDSLSIKLAYFARIFADLRNKWSHLGAPVAEKHCRMIKQRLSLIDLLFTN